jgi:glycosidase
LEKEASMSAVIEPTFPTDLADASLRPRGSVHPSPLDWRDQTIYFLLPDRFSDGGEAARPLFDRAQPDAFRAQDTAAWMAAGRRFQGGTLKGVQSKLDYLRDLGVTTLWIGPVWRQRADLQTYHGYAIQNFLDVDPRYGTRQDLRDLVDAAHERGLYVLLDIIYNHSGNNWYYADDSGAPRETLPYRYAPPYSFHSWRSRAGAPTQRITDVDDAVFPREFQNPEWYTRAGQIMNWDPAGWEDPLNPNVEFRRGDFFDLKDFDHSRTDTLDALIKVYMYWIALSDCDGFRIDTVKHITRDASRRFCSAIREYCETIGKENFLLLGEVTGGEYLAAAYLDVFGQNLDAILDIGESKALLRGFTKGLGDPKDFFNQFSDNDILGTHREVGRYHVSVLDDHDMVGSPKRRFAAGVAIPARDAQVAHAVGVLLTTLGIPSIYYGSEQAFDGTVDRHDYSVEPQLSFDDRYVREAMFGGTFGAFKTGGCHFFDSDHPVYLRIAALARLRNRRDLIGMTLRRGRQYLREIAPAKGEPYVLPSAGEITAWSRLLFHTEVVIAFNTHGTERRCGSVTVDAGLNPPGTTLRIYYRGDWSDSHLRTPPTNETTLVEGEEGRSVVWVDLPPAGMMVLGR